jgi:hypothetical protein
MYVCMYRMRTRKSVRNPSPTTSYLYLIIWGVRVCCFCSSTGIVQLYGPRTTASSSHMMQSESYYHLQAATTTTTAETVQKRQQMDDPFSTLAMSQFSFLR